MQHFYDGAIRRYVTQTIRVLSEFTVRYSDGTLHRVPVAYGDSDRQAATIVRQNSENTVNSIPKISVYIHALDLDRDRIQDPTFVSKKSVREREIVDGKYTSNLGRNYTIERIMPTPFKLTMKVDIWTASTDQKLQIMEQLFMMFNPSLEIQASDNYYDWTSISVLFLDSVMWSSKAVPVGNDTPIDIGTLTLVAPIWISPPVKVKQLGVITKIITGLHDANSAYITGFGTDAFIPDNTPSSLMTQLITLTENYTIEVFNNQITLLDSHNSALENDISYDMPPRVNSEISWDIILDLYPNKFISGVARVFLMQLDGTEINGTVSRHAYEEAILDVNWDNDTKSPNTGIDSNGFFDTDPDYNPAGNRPNSPGTFDAIINPLTFNPHDHQIFQGLRYLLTEDIGNIENVDGADGWKSLSGDDLIARANDIIEWDGNKWNVIFNSVNERDSLIWQTNTYTGIQYMWNSVKWVKSFEGIYKVGKWRLEM
jgi:T4-like virus Myoviridae tail sheath stabiliser